MGDSIQSVMGIMNGTTNFMLTKMETEGADYAAVLKEAQDLGFAEGCCFGGCLHAFLTLAAHVWVAYTPRFLHFH